MSDLVIYGQESEGSENEITVGNPLIYGLFRAIRRKDGPLPANWDSGISSATFWSAQASAIQAQAYRVTKSAKRLVCDSFLVLMFLSLASSSSWGLTDGDATQLLADIAGATTSDAETALAELVGTDTATLLEGLSEAEAEELMELVADLTGLGSSIPMGTQTIGVAEPALRSMARDLEDRMTDHLYYGQIFLDVNYATPEKRTGEVVGLNGGSDSAIWSGHYLAAEAFRYAVARNKKDKAKNYGQSVVWGKEMQRAKQRIDTMVTGAHRNINISKNWKAKGLYSPTFDAEAGILFRKSMPEDTPSWQETFGPNRHEFTFGPIPWDDGKNYYCQGTFTRDQYTGWAAGLQIALDLVGPDDPALQATIRADLMTAADYLIRHGWSVVRPETSIRDSTPAVQPLANGISWCTYMAHAARHAARTGGSLADQAKWETLWTQTFAIFGPLLPGAEIFGLQSPSAGYYGHNLAHNQYFNLIRDETDLALREYFRQNLAIMDASTRDDGNAYFEAITYALTGEPERLDLALTHLREWLEYFARWSDGICMSCRCGIDIECIPEKQVTYTVKIPLADALPRPDGNLDVHRQEDLGNNTTLDVTVVIDDTSVIEVAGSIAGQALPTTAVVADSTVTIEVTDPDLLRQSNPNNTRSARVLRIADERTPQDFLWQRSPFNGSGGLDRAANPTEGNAGVDFLLPYYMLQYYTEVAPPAYQPWDTFPLTSR
ncbi:MAG: hypothetical protein HY706_19045 [Candidatus Hydrogenedentes bacterium]|nr:hypothetical protein [Candidatus Hydrogenedentota bacterium]